MKNDLKYVLAFSLLAFGACSSGEDDFADGRQQPCNALEMTVSASDFVTDSSAPGTRATDNGATTTFESGDRIGIIVLDNSNNVLSDNIPYIYNGSTWSFDNGNSEGKTAVYYDNKAGTLTYLAYFPYSVEANGATGIATLKGKFQPQPDQRTEDAYRASDLLVWSNTGSAPLKKLNIEFTHAYSSLSLSPLVTCKIDGTATSYTSSSVIDVSFTIGTEPLLAYRADDGSCRIIVSPQTTSARWFCSYKAKTYSGTMSETVLAANNRYTLAPALNIGAYTFANAQVGDFYCKNNSNEGYLIPGDAFLTTEQQAACIGIVYSTDANRIGATATQFLTDKSIPLHGLVMALTNASDGCRWGDYGKDENSGGADGEPFKANTDQLKQYENVDGYGETHWIIEAYESNGTTLKDTYTAFYHANLYGTAESSTGKYAVPSNTTGWFIPGMGQWWDILSNLGKIDLTSYQGKTDSYITISRTAQTAVANINKYLQKISHATQFSTDTYFWSSSESNRYRACYVGFYNMGDLDLGHTAKDGNRYRVRCIFAF